MRPDAMYKLGYYPTQPQTLAAIQTFLTAEPGTPIRLLDPCAGAGDALFHISRHLVVSTPDLRPDLRLVELDYTRSEQIRTTHADLGGDAALGSLESIRGDWFAVAMSEQAVGLALVNAPYDFDLDDPDNRKLRLEVKFLRNVTPKLQIGGVLVYIVPQRLLGHQKIVRWLAQHFLDEFYDLQSDPHELDNRINDDYYANQRTRPKERLRQWMEQTDDPLRPDFGKVV